MPSDSSKKISISDQVLSQRVGEETVLLDLAGENYFGLDPVGTRFWDLLQSGSTLPEIIEIMTAEFEVSAAQLEIDLLEFLAKLNSSGLIRDGFTDLTDS